MRSETRFGREIAGLAAGVLVAAAGYTVPVREDAMTARRAKGEFDVKLTPQSDDKGTGLGRLSMEKTWRGDLAGTSRGEMLTAMTDLKGSAGYAAVERVAGTVAGRKGSFALQHDGVMDRGRQSLEIRIVPDSGTGELAGIAGTLKIQINGGKHFYELEYTLGESQ